MQKYKERSE